ncbi:MAG: ion transporter, partial [Aminivibrio sp.]
MKTFSSRRDYYSRKIDFFFRRPYVEAALIVLIGASILAAIASLLFDDDLLEGLNIAFSVLFAAELTARYITYEGRGRDYLRDWWMDWAATIPWDILLVFMFPGGGASMLRLLRLPRIFRLLRFRRIKRSEGARWASYRFRRLMEVSIWRQSLTLLLVSLVFVWFFTLLLDRAGMTSEHGGNFWFSLITMISSDSIFEMAGQDSMVKGLVLLLSFIGIILFNGILIAIIIGKLMEHLEKMKDAGEVRERGHIILLGWNECIPHILNELESFCVSERKPPVKVVVMGETPPHSSGWGLASSPYVKVITRTGSFQNEEALERISAHKATALVVLGENSDDKKLSERLNDPIVTRTLLSFETLLDDKKQSRRGAAAPVTILNYLDLGNSLHVTDFLRPFGPGNARIFFNPLFFVGNLISAMCLNPYAEDIFNELLTAEGNEFHFVSPPIEPGTVWRDIVNAFPRSVPVGYSPGEGEIRMAPLPEEPLPEDSRIVVLSENSWDSSVFAPGRKTKEAGGHS